MFQWSVPSDDQMPADSESVPSDTLEPDDHDYVQVLMFIRMWSGFGAEFISLRDRSGKHQM